MKRWVVREADARSLARVLALMGEVESAIAEGRVFLGRQRLSAERELSVGDEITVHTARATTETASILYQGEGIVVADKPASIPTISDHRGHEGTLVALVARELGVDPSSLHPTSRLDRGVSGVVVFATTEPARDRLVTARENGKYARRYVAITATTHLVDNGVWREPIGRHARDARLRAARGRDAVHAETRFKVVARTERAALLAITPITGRTHQIRVHASFAKAPLLGDVVYGGSARITSKTGAIRELDRIALHCAWVRLLDEPPFASALPEELREAWRALGGTDDAWEWATL